MANPFEVTPPNALQALLMQRQGLDDAYTARLRPLQIQEQESKLRGRDQLSQLLQAGGNPDYGRLAVGALAAGDPTSAGVLASIGNQNASRGIQERQLQLQERQAEEKPTYHVIQEEDASGNKRSRIVKLDPYGRGSSYVEPSGQSAAAGAPTNPYSTGSKVNESQSKDQLYASRMFGAERVLRENEEQGTDFWQRAKSKVPLIGNYGVSDQFQAYEQAKRDFVNAVLRRESGAAIGQSEFENAEKQYFPQPGDSKTTIDNKRRSRMEAIKGVAGGGGPSYRPPATFDESGELIPNVAAGGGPPPMGPPSASPSAMRQAGALAPIPGAPTAARPAPAQGEPDPDPNDGSPAANLARARIALRRGARPEVVAKRLMDGGINPDELGLNWGGN